jgi:hypothetical protein
MSPMAIPVGVAIPTTIGKNQVWFQMGFGITLSFPFEPLPAPGPPVSREAHRSRERRSREPSERPRAR